MASRFEKPDQGRQSQSHESGFLQIFRPRHPMRLATLRAVLGTPLMLCDLNREFFEFHLLEHLGRFVGVDQFAATTRTAGVVINPRDINLLGRKSGTLMSRMAKLAAAFPLLAAFPLRRLRRWRDDVTGRRLRGIGRVLLRLGQRRFQRRDALRLCGEARLQLGDLCLQPNAVRTSRLVSHHDTMLLVPDSATTRITISCMQATRVCTTCCS